MAGGGGQLAAKRGDERLLKASESDDQLMTAREDEDQMQSSDVHPRARDEHVRARDEHLRASDEHLRVSEEEQLMFRIRDGQQLLSSQSAEGRLVFERPGGGQPGGAPMGFGGRSGGQRSRGQLAVRGPAAHYASIQINPNFV
jgi:hypothetical protein